jgi:hypothetical protein
MVSPILTRSDPHRKVSPALTAGNPSSIKPMAITPIDFGMDMGFTSEAAPNADEPAI